MSTENNELVETVDEVNLDDFSADFFGQKEPEIDETKSEDEPEDLEQESDAPEQEEDTLDSEDDDTLAPEDDDETEEEDESEDETDDKPQPKKNRFQERINELVAQAREAERREQAALERLSAIEKKLEQGSKPEPENKVESSDFDGPTPSDKKEDGTDKYPLGEFDPNYIKDLTLHTLKAEQEAREKQAKEEAVQKQIQEQRQELETKWNEKLTTARERLPDFQEKGEQLLGTFEGIDEAYGDYLTTTIMSMDNGPDVLYYLANNVEEAQKIVDSGPALATLALGRLEARFSQDADTTQPKSRPSKVSKAPTPPPTVKGSGIVKGSVAPDTDDLDAFSKAFFAGKK